MSRNKNEGKYVGRWRYKHLRRKKDMPGLYAEDEELFGPYPPFVDAAIAWVTYKERNPEAAMVNLKHQYVSKADKSRYGV